MGQPASQPNTNRVPSTGETMLTTAEAQVNTKSNLCSNSISHIEFRYITNEHFDFLQELSTKFLFFASGDKKISFGALKLICSRDLKYGSCITKQQVMAKEVCNFGSSKVVGERQLRRILEKLREAGLITYERSGKKRSANRYEATALGRELYFLFIQDNRDYIQYKLSTKSVDKSVDNRLPVDKVIHKIPVSSFQNCPNSVQFKLNVLSNMDIHTGIKKNINIMRVVKNCTILFRNKLEKYKMSHKPETEDEIERLRLAYSQDPDPKMDPAPRMFSIKPKPKPEPVTNRHQLKERWSPHCE